MGVLNALLEVVDAGLELSKIVFVRHHSGFERITLSVCKSGLNRLRERPRVDQRVLHADPEYRL